MKEFFYTPQAPATGELTEKRSKFLAEIRPVTNEQEAAAFINKVRSRHRDARHTVFSYVLADGKKRYSDDGEPSGTAGAPITEILEKNGYRNCAVTVTRYFGGILLGTGGLVRAYSGAANEAIKNCSFAKMVLKTKLGLNCGYNFYNRIPSILSKYKGKILCSDFSQDVSLTLSLPPEFCDAFSDCIFELSGGTVAVNRLECLYEKE